jgi:hypothetical protein
MDAVSRALAIFVCGMIAFGVLSMPIGLSIGALVGGKPGPSATLAIFAAYWLVVVAVAIAAPTSRTAWGRLFLLDGIASLALPLQGLIFSSIIGAAVVSEAKGKGGVAAAAAIGPMGDLLTGPLGFIGFFLGLVLIVCAYLTLHGARARY